MARRGVFVRAEEVAFLEEVRRWRQQCVLVLTRAKPQGPLYNATSKVIEAIDAVAEAVTGDRRTFYQRDATMPAARSKLGLTVFKPHSFRARGAFASRQNSRRGAFDRMHGMALENAQSAIASPADSAIGNYVGLTAM